MKSTFLPKFANFGQLGRVPKSVPVQSQYEIENTKIKITWERLFGNV